MKHIDTVCIGSIILDISSYQICQKGFFEREPNEIESITFAPGGDAANEATVLASMGYKTVLLSKVGGDDGGSFLLSRLKKSGVDTSHVTISPMHVTPMNNTLIGESDKRIYITNASVPNSALLDFSEEDLDFDLLEDTKIVSIGSLFVNPKLDGAALKRVFCKVKEAGGITCADVKVNDFSKTLSVYAEALPYLDYLFVNQKEAEFLSGLSEVEEMAAFFLDLGLKTVIIKLGEKGCYLQTKSGEAFYETPFYVEAVDTTGAGDNFMAGFMSGLIQGLTDRECVQYAKATSAICVSTVGASTGVKSREQVEEFLTQHMSK